MTQEKIIDRLTADILSDEYFIKLFNKCLLINAELTINNSITVLEEKELLHVLRFADILSNSENSGARNKSYQIVTCLNLSYSKNPFYQTASKAIYSKLGNFPAVNYLERINENNSHIPIDRTIELEAKKLIQQVPDSDFYFTDSQYSLYKLLSSNIRYSFSGPTSMGKSFIIKAFIKKAMLNNPPENLVVLVPTRALINQFTIDLKVELKEFLEIHKYKIATNSAVSDISLEETFNYIFILTPERLISYLSQTNNPPIGFLFVDEAHKLAQEKDSRSITTYSAIEKTLNKYGQNVKLYFSSPNVSNPEVFLNLFHHDASKNWYKTEESPVTQNLYFIDLLSGAIELIYNDVIQPITPLDIRYSVSQLIQKLGKNSNNLVYNNSKPKTINGAVDFAKNIVKEQQISKSRSKAAQQIRDYIHQDYFLADLIEKGIAYHHGKLPQLIRNMVEQLYKDEEVTNVFCTSTLLEGVNMPTKNLFILDYKNGRSKLEKIDFWNLTGRAGRLNKELSGNIYCIQHEDCIWEEKKDLLIKQPIELKPTVLNRIDKNIQKIEKILLDKDISGTETETEILKYIANIICIDTLEIKSTYRSPIIEQLIKNKKGKILELAKNISQNIKVPLEILNANQSIGVKRQHNIFLKLQRAHAEGKRIKLPNSTSIKYELCEKLLNFMYDLYDWSTAEKKLQNKNSMKYYATIMNQWINGLSLNQIISQSLDYYSAKELKVDIGYNEFVPYQRGNRIHMNIVIEKVIDDIEYILRFLFEKYFNHYYQMVKYLLGEDSAGENWATLLEYGTQNRIIITLQNMGLSRHTAMQIYKKTPYALNVQNEKLVGINKIEILKNFKNTSIEYHEILTLL